MLQLFATDDEHPEQYRPVTEIHKCALRRQLEFLRHHVPGAYLCLPEYLRKFYVSRTIPIMNALEQGSADATDDGAMDITVDDVAHALGLDPVGGVAAAADAAAMDVANHMNDQIRLPDQEPDAEDAAAMDVSDHDRAHFPNGEPEMEPIVVPRTCEVPQFKNAFQLIGSEMEMTMQPEQPELQYQSLLELFKDAGHDNLKNVKWVLVDYACAFDSVKAVISALTLLDKNLLWDLMPVGTGCSLLLYMPGASTRLRRALTTDDAIPTTVLRAHLPVSAGKFAVDEALIKMLTMRGCMPSARTSTMQLQKRYEPKRREPVTWISSRAVTSFAASSTGHGRNTIGTPPLPFTSGYRITIRS